ncbi:MAG: FMN-binding protein [Clostridiales bacterium]|nr:FMN-binding protein [Clostridiales bacterium]
MTLFLNILFAWASMILAGLLAVIIVMRIVNKYAFKNKKNIIYKINRYLRKIHKSMGVAIIVTGFYHGLFSSDAILSINYGTAVWVLTIILAATWIFKAQLKKIKNWMYWHRVIAAIFVIVLVIHVIDVGGFIGVPNAYSLGFNPLPQATLAPIEEIEALIEDTGVVYKNGEYIGVANGYGPDLTVKVVIENQLISSVEVVSHNEDRPMYYQMPMEKLPIDIIKSQSPIVDTVSGATYTSYGIINATIDALSQAILSGEIEEKIDVEEEHSKPEGEKGGGKGQGKNH